MFEWRPVTTKAEFDAWLALTEQIYGRQPTHFVPPLVSQVQYWWQQRYKTAVFSGLEFYGVYDQMGRIVARTTAHQHLGLSEKLAYQAQLFGYTEWVDQPGVVDFLWQQLEAVAAANRAQGLFGPVSLLPNQAGGVVTAGFDQPAFVDGAYSPPYYARDYQKGGFKSRFAAQTWQTHRPEWTKVELDKVFAGAADALPSNLQLKKISGWGWANLIPALGQVLNDSFAQLGYYTFIPEAELRRQVKDLAAIIDPEIALYIEQAGKPVAFCLCIPDISAILRRSHGKPQVWDWLKLLWQRRNLKEAVLIIQGTVPAYQGQGLSKALTHQLVRNLLSSGYTKLRTTWIEPSNLASSAQLKKVGAQPLHEVTFFERKF
jgi:GNAT superfamily N-acetyltransferase